MKQYSKEEEHNRKWMASILKNRGKDKPVKHQKKNNKYKKPKKARPLSPHKIAKLKKNNDSAILAKAYSLNLTERATREEKIMIEILDFYKIRYKFQYTIQKNESFFIVDFWVNTPTFPLVIEIDGYHHFTPEGISKDKIRAACLKKWANCIVLRFNNADMKNKTEEVAQRVLLELTALQLL